MEEIIAHWLREQKPIKLAYTFRNWVRLQAVYDCRAQARTIQQASTIQYVDERTRQDLTHHSLTVTYTVGQDLRVSFASPLPLFRLCFLPLNFFYKPHLSDTPQKQCDGGGAHLRKLVCFTKNVRLDF